jgi:hypothetical protein
MSTVAANITATLNDGKVKLRLSLNGQLFDLVPVSGVETEKVIEAPTPKPSVVFQDNYDKMKRFELALLCARRGLPYTRNRKSDYVEQLRQQDASGNVPIAKPCAPTDYDRMNWCELYEICKGRGIKLENGRRLPNLIQALRESDTVSV